MSLAPTRMVTAASSGTVAANTAAATLSNSGKTGQRLYCTGFIVTGTGATSGLAIAVTVTGLTGGTQTYAFAAPAGVLVMAAPLVVQFADPIPALTETTDVVISMPTFGSGNTNACVVITGFYA